MLIVNVNWYLLFLIFAFFHSDYLKIRTGFQYRKKQLRKQSMTGIIVSWLVYWRLLLIVILKSDQFTFIGNNQNFVFHLQKTIICTKDNLFELHDVYRNCPKSQFKMNLFIFGFGFSNCLSTLLCKASKCGFSFYLFY